MSSFYFMLYFIFLSNLYKGSSALECMQCDKNTGWYSEEEQEKQVHNCQKGLIEPTKCRNESHTHCIVSWFRSGVSSERTVTERKCGTVDEVTGCTLYNSNINNRRKVRHLLTNDASTDVARESTRIFVEVCSDSCPFGDCINSTPAPISSVISFLVLYLTTLFIR